MQSERASSLAFRPVDELFAMPVMTYGGAANLLGVTQRAARLNVEKLVESGILKEASGRRRNRVFAATEIIGTLEAPKQLIDDHAMVSESEIREAMRLIFDKGHWIIEGSASVAVAVAAYLKECERFAGQNVGFRTSNGGYGNALGKTRLCSSSISSM